MTVDLRMLREIKVDTSDAHTIGILVDNGGEIPWYPHTCKPETLDRVEATIRKGLVEVIARDSRNRLFLRLTDMGRRAAEDLEKLKVAPKIEVATGGAATDGGAASGEGAGSP